jgi:hypothetical protein
MLNTDRQTANQFPMQWVADMDVDVQPKAARKTSIICTIGPKTNNVEKLAELIDAGMNIVRMNFSHGDYDYHKSVLDNARAAAASKYYKKNFGKGKEVNLFFFKKKLVPIRLLLLLLTPRVLRSVLV